METNTKTIYTPTEVLAMIEELIIPDTSQTIPFIQQSTRLTVQIEALKVQLRSAIKKAPKCQSNIDKCQYSVCKITVFKVYLCAVNFHKQLKKNIKIMFDDAETYSVDLELFHKLGLKTFKTDSQQKLFVGEYKLPGYDKANVKISVTCMPAQFWQFEVETDEDYKCVINTGSGSLSDYWPSVLKVADGCFVVNAL